MRSETPASPSSISLGVRWSVALIGVFCSLLGLTVLLGWVAHIPRFVQLGPTMAPMQFNTALCFVLAGTAISAWVWRQFVRPIALTGILILTLGTLTLAEYLTG